MCACANRGKLSWCSERAGGVGTTAVEIARAMGARVIAAVSSDEKAEFARSVGASETVNYSEFSLKDSVRQLTDGKGVEYCL